MHQPQSWDWDARKNDYMDTRGLNNIHSGSAPSLAGFSFEPENGNQQNFSQPTQNKSINNKLEVAESNLMVIRSK